MNTLNTIENASLYFTEGRSNKEYHAELTEVAGGYAVNFRYGRRGGTLTVGSKTSTPIEFDQAKLIYDKLIRDKTAKGYTPDSSGSTYQTPETAARKSDFLPQLLNPVTGLEATRLNADDHWAAQEKMDGERRAAHAEADSVIGINRKGLNVPLPQGVADELQQIALQYGAIRVDGELIGEKLYVFDLLIHQGLSLQSLPWLERMRLAEIALAGCTQIIPVPVATTTDKKRALWIRVRLGKGEGVVFKRMDSLSQPGRPNSGGDWLKFKFTESASCCVLAVNAGKRSVQIGLLANSDQSESLVPVGNVTIPRNHVMPVAGDLIEVEYLYAYRGGSLYQPVYRGQRVDLTVSACTLMQLKYKPEGTEEDDA